MEKLAIFDEARMEIGNHFIIYTMKKTRFMILLAASLCFMLPAQAQKDSKTTFAKDALQPYVDNGQLSGAISVFYKDGVQETCCVGYADVSQKRRIKMDNVFMQCSQTKGFCGVTIAKLVEEGRISLDDPVSKYLPEFAELWVLDEEKDGVRKMHKAKNVLTVRMVLNHTGGFPFEISAKRSDVRGGGWSGGAPLRQTASIAAASPLLSLTSAPWSMTLPPRQSREYTPLIPPPVHVQVLSMPMRSTPPSRTNCILS